MQCVVDCVALCHTTFMAERLCHVVVHKFGLLQCIMLEMMAILHAPYMSPDVSWGVSWRAKRRCSACFCASVRLCVQGVLQEGFWPYLMQDH